MSAGNGGVSVDLSQPTSAKMCISVVVIGCTVALWSIVSNKNDYQESS
jgi:hypothetical protein